MRELVSESLIPLNGCKITSFFINMQKNRYFSAIYPIKKKETEKVINTKIAFGFLFTK